MNLCIGIGKMRNRLYGLDFFRLLSVLMVFFFHSNIHINCDYGFATPFIRCGAIFMTGFFMLSGFVISYVSGSYCGKVIPFLKRRIIGIMPAYWGICIIYPLYNIAISIFQGDAGNMIGIMKDTLFLLPIEFFGLQSAFDSLFSVSHNGGTWFVSCLLVCYFSFPLLNQITEEMTNKQKIISLGVVATLLIYATFIPHIYNTSFIYTNILFRIFEFFIGGVLAKIFISDKIKMFLSSWYVFCLEVIILVAGTLKGKELITTSDFMVHEWCVVPCFALMLVTLSSVKTPRWLQSKAMSYGCEISYMFFFAQFFTWTPVMIVLNRVELEESNLIKVVFAFCLCSFIAITLHECIEKPAKKIVQKII